jgi:enoyl-CoA hydratase
MTVDVERRGAITMVTINNPERRNALDRDTFVGLGAAFESAQRDDDVRCIVLTAVGDRAFCAGADLRSTGGGGGAPMGLGPGVFTERFYGKPIIAAVNGAAVGGGLGIALGCDIIVAVDDAVFGLPEVQRGLIGAGAATRAAIRLTPALAMEFALTGEPISAARAYEIGLVNRVVPRHELLPTALAIAERIAANAPLAVYATKEAVYETLSLNRVDMAALRGRVAPVLASEDAQEGRQAWAERRPPVYKGR